MCGTSDPAAIPVNAHLKVKESKQIVDPNILGSTRGQIPANLHERQQALAELRRSLAETSPDEDHGGRLARGTMCMTGPRPTPCGCMMS